MVRNLWEARCVRVPAFKINPPREPLVEKGSGFKVSGMAPNRSRLTAGRASRTGRGLFANCFLSFTPDSPDKEFFGPTGKIAFEFTKRHMTPDDPQINR